MDPGAASPRRRASSAAGGAVALALFVALLAVALARAGAFAPLDLGVYDRLVASGAGASAAPISLIQIGESDIARFGHPLSDELLARVLGAVLDASPRAVGIDLYRDRAIEPGAAALRARGADLRVVFVEKLPGDDGAAVAPPDFAKRAQVGFSDLSVDPDGVARRGLLFHPGPDGEQHLSFALQLARRFLAPEGVTLTPDERDPARVRLGPTPIAPFEADDGGYRSADAGGVQWLLDFGAAPFPRNSLSELLDGGVAPARLRDRVVLLGTDAPSVKDHFTTPLASRGTDAAGEARGDRQTPGTELQAHAIAQLIRFGRGESRPIASLPGSLEDALTALFAALGVLLGHRLRSPFALSGVALAGLALGVATSAISLRAGLWIPVLPPLFAAALALSLSVARVARRERNEKATLMGIFGRHVSPTVAERLWEDRDAYLEGGRPRTQRLPLTILMADLVGFSQAAGRLEPAELLGWLNRCMGMLARTAEDHGGVVEDFAGDGIKVNFGVPVPRCDPEAVREDALAAIRSARAMAAQLGTLNRSLASSGLPEIRVRVGIESGDAVVGCMGAGHLKYTSVGESVIVAARLESLDREDYAGESAEEGLRLLIGPQAADLVKSVIPLVECGTHLLRGRSEPVPVYALSDPPAGDAVLAVPAVQGGQGEGDLESEERGDQAGTSAEGGESAERGSPR